MSFLTPLNIEVPNFINILQTAQQYRDQQQIARLREQQLAQAQQEQQRRQLAQNYSSLYLSSPEGSEQKAIAGNLFAQVAPEDYVQLRNHLLNQQLIEKKLQPTAPKRTPFTNTQLEIIGSLGLNPDDPATRSDPNFIKAMQEEIKSRISGRTRPAATTVINNNPALEKGVRSGLEQDIIGSQANTGNLLPVLSSPALQEQFATGAAAKATYLRTKERAAGSPIIGGIVKPLVGALSQTDARFLANRKYILGNIEDVYSNLLREKIGAAQTETELKNIQNVLAGEASSPTEVRAVIGRLLDRTQKGNQLKVRALAEGIPLKGPQFEDYVAKNNAIFSQPPSREVVNAVAESFAKSGLRPDQVKASVLNIFPELAGAAQGAQNGGISQQLLNLPPVRQGP